MKVIFNQRDFVFYVLKLLKRRKNDVKNFVKIIFAILWNIGKSIVR